MIDPLLDNVRTALAEQLTPGGAGWFAEARSRVAADPAAIRTLFPAAGRCCGRGPLGPHRWTVDDAARALLIAELPLSGAELAAEVADLYRYGDAAEKRGVLRSLQLLDDRLGDRALPLVRDGLRTNDTRLVAAALAAYGAERLDAAAYRQGVLKCVFLGIPLADVDGLDRRADAELARMFADYARERTAAGREVPADVWPVIDRFIPTSPHREA